MAKSDTWPGGVAMEALSNMDSAGSCDSVISVNSCYSEDSMEHLSAEERACLMYLEETIEALEVQEDSGLSNDEPDSAGAVRVNDISNTKSAVSGKDSDQAEHRAPNEISEPQSSPADTRDVETSLNLVTQPDPTASESRTGCEIHSSATPTQLLCLSKDGDSEAETQPPKASEIDLSLIPPPSDFMDDPVPPPEPEEANDPPLSAGLPSPKPTVVVEMPSASSEEPPNKPQELPPSAVQHVTPPLDFVEPKSPPAVAPKPKKLPPNIILKSHKPAVVDSSSVHSVPHADFLDPQKVHMEALRKLGLLKSDDSDSGPALSPKLSPKTRRSWASPPSPASHTPPTTPSYTTRVHSPSPTSTPVLPPAVSGSFAAPVVQLPVIVPAPAAFSDPEGPEPSDMSASTPPSPFPPSVKRLTPPKAKNVKSATLERSGLSLSSFAGDEDSEVNLGACAKQSPGQLRNTRPRPASLGSGKEFSGAQREGPQAGHPPSNGPDLRRSLPAFQHSGDSQKLPRSQGISVLICPRAENGDNRREALKRLGLLRD